MLKLCPVMADILDLRSTQQFVRTIQTLFMSTLGSIKFVVRKKTIFSVNLTQGIVIRRRRRCQ